jgi:formylglycine-generating enzyme required for sulfatase activity
VHQAAWAKYLGVPVEYTNSIGMKFRLIPPGEFLMGSTPEEIEAALVVANKDQAWRERISSEVPRHKVTLTQPVYVGVNEVTQAQYEQVMGTNPSHLSASGEGKDAIAGLETGNHPVEMVSWNDAAEFCIKLSQQDKRKPFYLRSEETVTPLEGTGYRLPTEAEWEFASRAGTTARFWSGDEEQDLIEVGWFKSNSGGRSHAVGDLAANPFGLSDVHGNVWEWTQDSWDQAFYGTFQEKAAINPSSPFSTGSQRVLRGGSWGSHPLSCRSSARYAYPPEYRAEGIGFRVVLPVDAVKQRPRAAPAGPSTDADVKQITALPAEQQIEEVSRELMRHNSAFDGKLTPTIQNERVTGLEFNTSYVSDISPVRALVHLEKLVARGTGRKGSLSDLSPLQGMRLTILDVKYNKIQDLAPLRDMPLKELYTTQSRISDLSPLQGMALESLDVWHWTGTDLSPLKGMPLKSLNIGGNERIHDLTLLAGMPLEYLCINHTKVSDLTPIENAPLTELLCQWTLVSDLSPVRGKKLERLWCYQAKVTDLSILHGMPLTHLSCDFVPSRDTEILRSFPMLESINDKPAAEFWREVEQK